MIKGIIAMGLLLSVNLFADLFVDGLTQYDKGNPKQASEIWTKACGAGDINGCYNLAVLYDHGDGVKQNKTKAIELYKKACETGDEEGCTSYKILNEEAVK